MGRGKKGRLGLFHFPSTTARLRFFLKIITSFTFEYPAEVSAEGRSLSLFWSNYSKKFQLPTTSFVFLRLSGEPDKNASKDRLCNVKSRKTKKTCTHLWQRLLFVAVQYVVKYINKDQFIIFHQSATFYIIKCCFSHGKFHFVMEILESSEFWKIKWTWERVNSKI